MKARVVVPDLGMVELDEIVGALRPGKGASTLAPFAPETIAFCALLGATLMRDPETRRYPELVALAFWMRKGEITRMRDEFAAGTSGAGVRAVKVPCGLVFHLPPGNVDTIFIYSWLLSVLAGNRNVIRLSARQTPQVALLCRVFNECLARPEGEALRGNTTMVSYGHEAEITQALSSMADVRTIWGGDRTVSLIRAIPLPPHAKELTFADRYSLCAIGVVGYAALDDARRDDLAEKFFNDTYWFDQLGCSSPRLVVWCGESPAAADASRDFFARVKRQIERKGYRLEAADAIAKLTFASQSAIDRPVTELSQVSNELMLMPLASVDRFDRDHCGRGFFFQYFTDRLTDLADFVERRDQTLSQFGFAEEELVEFAKMARGRGIDRIVPIGDALTFSRFWDGYDLLEEFTRRVTIQAAAS